jgi:hypothetical protein
MVTRREPNLQRAVLRVGLKIVGGASGFPSMVSRVPLGAAEMFDSRYSPPSRMRIVSCLRALASAATLVRLAGLRHRECLRAVGVTRRPRQWPLAEDSNQCLEG